MRPSTYPDLRLYLVTDPSFGSDLRRVVVPAVEGGVTCVQVRAKRATVEELTVQVESLRDALAGSGVPLLSNDHVVRAAAGVHGGAGDAHPTVLRAQVGPDAFVGWSVEHLGQLDDEAAVSACSYVAVSPVHDTATKRDTAPPLGLRGVAHVARRVDGLLPVVGIGGLDEDNARGAVAAGLDGIAVVRAIGGQADPGRAARRLRHVVDTALADRDGGVA